MSDSLAAVVLAAGIGTRLRPLTHLRPKPLCPVGDRPLVDHAIDRVAPVVAPGAATDEHVAVNVHAGRAAMEDHLDERVHLSIEAARPLGTAGALGQLRSWIAGRGTVVVNADAWCPGSVDALVAGWDGERVRLLLVGEDELGPRSAVAGALMPWSEVAALEPEPTGLYEVSWRRAGAEGRLEVVRHDGPFVDCGTPRDYLRANLAWSGGTSVVGQGATVEGHLERSVVWPGAEVGRREVLVDAIRADRGITVLVR